jgi:integrase
VNAFILKRQKDVMVVGEAGDRQERRYSNGEINRELTTLKRILNLARQNGKLMHVLHVPMLKERNVRPGFFEREQYEAVVSKLPKELRPIVTFAYVTGWRINSEVLTLQWRNVDLKAGEVRLDVGATKNKAGRVVPLNAELRRLFEERLAEHRALKAKGVFTPWVFFRMVAKGRGGEKQPKPIRAFDKAWKAACIAAGCPGRIKHDFRRTACRNFIRRGVPETVAMRITGHKTRAVFDRYNIVSDADLRDAMLRLGGEQTSTPVIAR